MAVKKSAIFGSETVEDETKVAYMRAVDWYRNQCPRNSESRERSLQCQCLWCGNAAQGLSGSYKYLQGRVGKTRYFLAVCVDISKTVRDTTKVTTND